MPDRTRANVTTQGPLSDTGPKHCRRGNVLLVVVLLLFGLAAASAIFYAFQSMTVRQSRARNWTNEAQNSAEAVARVMGSQLVSTAEMNLGVMTQDLVDSLNATVDSITVPDGVTLDDETGYYVTRIEAGEVVAYDDTALVTTTDHPRFAFEVPPVYGPERAAQTVEVVVVAKARVRAARSTVRARYAISKFLPHPFAVYTDGDLDACVAASSELDVAGLIRTEGTFLSRCDGPRRYWSDIWAQQGVTVTDLGPHEVALDSTALTALPTITAGEMETNPGSVLAATGGRVRVGAGIGDAMVPSRFQTASVAGTGECSDRLGACGGAGSFFPSVQLQRATTGPSTDYDLRCGWAYGAETCAPVGTAIAYVPYPWTDHASPDSARIDPSDPNRLWQGLYPDYRRESRCTAVLPTDTVYRTFRCITNAFGYVVDMAAMPAVSGGLLHVQGWTSPPAGMNPYQEVLYLKNATTLPSPLTIVSEIPVVIEGSYNTASALPAMIDAPLITVLPAEADDQLATAAVWDSTSTTVPTALAAYSPVRVRAVLRGDYHVTGANYYGGTLEQIPAVLGDFSGVSLEVWGAVEGREVPLDASSGYASWHAPYGAEPSEMATWQPAGRRIIHDPLLNDATRQPRGSWYWPNIPAAGAGGSRTQVRQVKASGGFAIVRRLEDPTPVTDAAPSTVALPSTGMPAAPTASFTATEDEAAHEVTFDASASADADGVIQHYHWDLGDGAVAAGSMVILTHQYTGTGPYTVTLTVRDNDGLVAVETQEISVNSPRP